MQRHTLLLTTEGTYPHYRGGVSVWCHQLVKAMPETDFHVFAIADSPARQPAFAMPDNVLELHMLPLWGTEEPGWEPQRFSKTWLRKLRTTPGVMEKHFGHPFSRLMRCLLVKDSRPEDLAEAMIRLHEYFQEYDYAKTMASPLAWTIFLDSCGLWFELGGKLELGEATNCMRWLHRYLAVLSYPFPRTEITHASMAGLAGVPGVLQKLSHGTKFLLTEHGIYLRELYMWLDGLEYSQNCKRFLLSLNEAIVRMNYRYADTVTALCDFNRRWQLRLGADENRIHLTPNGVDPALFRPRQIEHEVKDPTVLVMSRIFALKGIDVVLRAAALVKARIPNVKFRILGDVGDAAYYAKCLAIAEECQLGDSVSFSHTDNPAAAYGTAHVFCLPSISEGMPFSVLEAMFSGVPVVASDVGGVADLLGGTGLLVNPRNHAGLANALLALLESDEKRHGMAAEALARARAHFTLAGATVRYARLYDQLLKENDDEQSRADYTEIELATA